MPRSITTSRVARDSTVVAAAGNTPESVSRRNRSAVTRAGVALVACLALFLAAPGGASGSTSSKSDGARPSVESAEAKLADAVAARSVADSRLTEARARQETIRSEIDKLSADARSITNDLAKARSDVREYAVAAYIDGGQGALVSSSLDPNSRAEVAWHTQLVGSSAADAADAVDRFNALKAVNDPSRVEAARRLDLANAEAEAAFDDVVQAEAFERDAEAGLATARAAEAAKQAEATRLAQQASVTSAEATGATATKVPSQALSPGSSATGSASPSVDPPRSSGGASTGLGSPTASESATLAKIRHCESRGNYGIVSASGRYRGAYQFDVRTWGAMGGSGDPAAASPGEQNYRALLLLRQRGTRPWPNCG